ncbi:MAG TPA: metallophosphatase domain-containing protein [Candidatus Tectomicrobia bacterium]|nr:metallophosphatase domain-containing protein [Candidatus Tectomicrobia bacterium]
MSLRAVFLSDTHGLHGQVAVPDGDVVVHCGDVSNVGESIEIGDFLRWFAALPHRHKIFVAGNHDWIFLKQPDAALSMVSIIAPGVHYLQDSGVAIDGLRFWGSPWQPEFCGWAFNLPRGKALADKWATIPDDTNVLITHGPPQGIQDTIRPGGLSLGCSDLTARVQQLPQLQLHAFGHIHGGYGEAERDGVRFVNASICTELYQPTNAPIVVDIPSG